MFELGETPYTHLANEEYQKISFGSHNSNNNIPREGSKFIDSSAYSSTISQSIDWSNTPAVTPVRDQGFCGSCWAFATVGALQAALFVKFGVQKVFSEEQLVSCDRKELGCRGGNPHNIYEWVATNKGLVSLDQFPYVSGILGTSAINHCDVTLLNRESRLSNVTIAFVKPHSALALRAAISQQPVVVFMDGSSPIFQNYRGGIINSPDCGNETNHAMLAVGYGQRGGVQYIKLKNSYGTNWGEDGYVLIASNEQGNYCGVLLDATYPVLLG